MKSEKGWYHYSDFDNTEIIYYDGESMVPKCYGNPNGPWATFRDAKRDAIAYHKCTQQVARFAINHIRSMKKPKVVK